MRYKSHMDNDSMNIGQLLLKVTKQYQNNVAIECDEQKLTYFELFKQAYSIIGWLRSFESSRVAIFMSREINVYCMIYACVLSGKTYMPIPLTSSKENISYMLQKAHIDYVITDKQNFVYVEELNKCCEYNFNVILFEDLIQKLDYAQNQLGNYLENYYVPNSTYVYIMFTSGSTGKAKAVGVKHSQLNYYLVEMVKQYQPNHTDKFSQVIELTFDLSVHDIFLCWSVGATLMIFNGKNYFQLAKYLEYKCPTFWLSVPSTGLVLEQAKLLVKNKYESLKVVLFCGEPLPINLALKWQDACPNAIIENLYGPTEATIAFTRHRFSGHEVSYSIVPIGIPLSGLLVRVVKNNLTPCEIGESGELLLGGAQVVDGYLGDSEKTLNRFIKTSDGLSWYRTGDIVVEDSSHILHFKGRVDDQLQIRGVRVERLDLEIQFREVLGISNIAIIPSPVTEDGLILGVALIYVINNKLKSEEIMIQCRDAFYSPFYPTEFIGINKLPINTSGKVDYKLLNTLYQKKIYNITTDRYGVNDV